MEFLRTQKAILSFADNRITIGGQFFRELPLVQHKTYLLRARTKTLVNVSCEFGEGSSYIPHIKAGPGIFAGEGIVKAHEHRAPLFIVNATSYDISLTLQSKNTSSRPALGCASRDPRPIHHTTRTRKESKLY
ncbi:unnamed protein product [Trichogramma brassicae]|uniref:Uncharacterized protein n=1 Tax=Trichogramma brassicae TaxID=86971 RepID=A0A6H5IVD5_9HYME|nr:unnamed protein product [Trichogramma brassicae]